VDLSESPVLQRASLFSGVSLADRAKICAASRIKEFPRDMVIYCDGESVRQVVLLTSGIAKITKLGWSGTEVILRIKAPGDVLGASALLSTGTHCSQAQALRLCRGLLWDALTFKVLVSRHPFLRENLLRSTREHLLELEQRFHEVATERVASRVARQLLRLQEKIGRPVKGTVEIGVSREELAQMTGTTLFTVSRLLSAWGVPGIVKPGHESVTICDAEALRSVCEEHQPGVQDGPAGPFTKAKAFRAG
jgi:CRP-like cAMP-binding protein